MNEMKYINYINDLIKISLNYIIKKHIHTPKKMRERERKSVSEKEYIFSVRYRGFVFTKHLWEKKKPSSERLQIKLKL